MSKHANNPAVAYFPGVPFHQHLGVEILETADDYVKMRLPHKKELTGGGDAYHGGVVASLMDCAGSLACYCGHDLSKGFRGSTVTLTIQYISAARGENLIAEGQVNKRGKELIFSDVTITTENEGRLIAKGVLVYRLV